MFKDACEAHKDLILNVSACISASPSSLFQLRPPQPAVYLFLLDVSHNAVEAGYLKHFCESLLENLDK